MTAVNANLKTAATRSGSIRVFSSADPLVYRIFDLKLSSIVGRGSGQEEGDGLEAMTHHKTFRITKEADGSITHL